MSTQTIKAVGNAVVIGLSVKGLGLPRIVVQCDNDCIHEIDQRCVNDLHVKVEQRGRLQYRDHENGSSWFFDVLEHEG